MSVGFDSNRGIWIDNDTGAQVNPDGSPITAAATNPYANPALFGADNSNTTQLLDNAAKKLGISVPDWTPYAQGIVQRDRIGGGAGWELGASSAVIANHILRELSFDPKYSAKFAALPQAELAAIRNAPGQGYYTKGSDYYNMFEQQGIQRDEDLRAKRASEKEFQFSDLIPMIIGGGFASAGGLGALLGNSSSALSAGSAADAMQTSALLGTDGAIAAGSSIPSGLAGLGDTAMQLAQAGLNDAPLGGYASAPDLTGFQTPYTPPTFGQEGLNTSSFLTPQPEVNPLLDIGTVTGTPAYSGAGVFQTPYSPPFEQAVNVNTAPAVTAPATNPATITPPSVTPPTTNQDSNNMVIPVAAGAAAAGLGSGTITSSGDVDLTGVGTNPNAYNADPAATAASNSAISRILAGTATADDWAKVAGQALPGLISAYGSSQQANNQKALTDQLLGFGAPSRARYEASMTPGFDPNTIPGYSAAVDNSSNAILRKLSASGGNPFGNPGGLIEANKAVVAGTALPAIQQYQNQNANTGQIGALTSAAPASAQNALSAGNNVYSDLGSAFSSVTNPQPDIADILRKLSSKSTSAYGLA